MCLLLQVSGSNDAILVLPEAENSFEVTPRITADTITEKVGGRAGKGGRAKQFQKRPIPCSVLSCCRHAHKIICIYIFLIEYNTNICHLSEEKTKYEWIAEGWDRKGKHERMAQGQLTVKSIIYPVDIILLPVCHLLFFLILGKFFIDQC